MRFSRLIIRALSLGAFVVILLPPSPSPLFLHTFRVCILETPFCPEEFLDPPSTVFQTIFSQYNPPSAFFPASLFNSETPFFSFSSLFFSLGIYSAKFQPSRRSGLLGFTTPIAGCEYLATKILVLPGGTIAPSLRMKVRSGAQPDHRVVHKLPW